MNNLQYNRKSFKRSRTIAYKELVAPHLSYLLIIWYPMECQGSVSKATQLKVCVLQLFSVRKFSLWVFGKNNSID
jgi:hypothetical protein